MSAAGAVGAIIGVDWGTSNLRAFRFGSDGATLETRRSEAGTSRINAGGFEAALRELIGDWTDGARARIFISGMAGSREGWVETLYLPCPVDLNAQAQNLAHADAALGAVWIAPGVSFKQESGVIEVMRGEETQIFGADADGLIVAPGTHSKWARVEAGRIQSVRTFMTGEVYGLLRSQSILKRLIQDDKHDAAAFTLGVERALAKGGALLNLAFSARTAGLFGQISPVALASYLSGIVIGAELAEGGAGAMGDDSVTVISADALAARYVSAFACAGVRDVRVLSGEEAAARGLWRLAQTKGAA